MIRLLSLLLLPVLSGLAEMRDALIVSQPVTVKAWQRQKVLAKNGELVDASGTLVSHVDAVAHTVLAANVTNLSLSTSAAVSDACQLLADNTNSIPDRAYSYSLHLEPAGQRENLTAHVIDMGSDGTNDVQWVRYSHSLKRPPNRTVVYESSGVSATAKAVWKDWTPFGIGVNGIGGYHPCTIRRPSTMIGLPCLTISNEVLGGDKGFSFGSLTVMVDGVLTFTGSVTNGETVLNFENGVLMQ